MKKLILTIAITTFFSIGISAQNKKDGTPDMRYSANKETYNTSNSTSSSTNSSPIYSGSEHTESHGGTYQGSTNSHHKNGTYTNVNTNNTYGVHKKK